MPADTGPADSSVDSTIGDSMVSDSASDTGDATLPDMGADAAVPMLDDPPDAPAPPVLTPCAEGYGEETVAGVTVCEPWEGAAPPTCGAGEAAFPGSGCTPIGTCPAGDWPEGLPADGEVVFVQASASAGGTGTRAAPFRTIEEGIDAAEANQTIAVAKGTYAETTMLRLPADGVSLVGACPLETRIESSAPVGIEVIFATGTIRALTITSTSQGIVVAFGVVATIEDVIVEDVPRNGILVGGGVANLDRVAVNGAGELGILITSDIGVRLSSVVVRDSGQGIRFQGSGESTLTQVAVVNAGDGGGILVTGHRVSGESVVVDGTTGVGIEAISLGSVELEDVVVRRADRGVHARMGATAAITRGWLANNRGTGMSALGGGTLMLVHSVVSNTASAAIAGVAGVGVRASGATLTNVLLSQNTDAALLVYEAFSSATFADLIIDGSTSGRGLDVEDGGTISGDRVSIDGSVTGLFAHGAGSAISANHALVERARMIGIVSTESGAVTIDRLGVLASGAAGIQVGSGGEMDLRNGEIVANPIGANIRAEGFDASRVQTSMTYRDNDVDLDMSELATPEPLLP